MKSRFIFCSVLCSIAVGVVASDYRPVVIWHGMGDRYDSPEMMLMMDGIRDAHKGIQVYPVRLSESGIEDQTQTVLGVINDQIDYVCSELKKVPGLENGFDGVGFSQGGLFLRAYAERCNNPPLKTLVTLGSPHNGIADLPGCDDSDFVCHNRNRRFKSHVFDEFSQTHSVPAQYYRDPENYEPYLEKSGFLAEINGERSEKNSTYKQNLSSLERLVLVLFDNERTVVPKESCWFHEYNRTSGVITPLEKRRLYTEDWIGLKTLGDKNLIEYVKLPGVHLEVSRSQISALARSYLGATTADQSGLNNNPNQQAILQDQN